jgi:hypothetical protein
VTERRWTAAALASQQQFLSELAAQGVVATPDLRFTRVVNGFSAIAEASAVALLERSTRVAGVYPVRAAFPSSVEEAPVDGVSPLPAGLAAYRGSGVTVALLDTAVDPATPFLHGRVLPGLDVLDGGPAARWDQPPGGDRIETHGTATAGIVAGLGRPGRPSGVAPEVTLLPIRVAGWQRDATGRWSIHARSDQVIAGLERAVDPNRDGDAHDAARITLVPLAEPFAAFSDNPLARAVDGAVALDTLVVVPAGNDGPGGPGFGSIAGPGGAPAALTVGAVDLRPGDDRINAVVRVGLRVLLRRPLQLLTARAPLAGTTVELVPVRNPAALFDANGSSRVAGRAALVAAGTAPRRAAARAGKAGAAVVVLAGEELAAGVLGLDPDLTAPVVSVPPSIIATVRAERAAGRTAWLSVGSSTGAASAARGRPASFSSWGLAFGGQLKPDVSAPGVGVATAVPGADEDGRSKLATVSGSSAAAAVAAGVAARLAQARPALDAAGLRSALTGTARPLARGPAAARGTGVVEPGRAAGVEIVTAPSTVAFGRGEGDGWQGRRELVLRSVSTRRLVVDLTARPRDAGIAVRVEPRTVRIAPGGVARILLRARVTEARAASAVIGLIRIAPRGSQPLHVPWTVVLSPPPVDLIGGIELSETSSAPSDLTPAVLAVRVGTIDRVRGRDVVQPALRLDVVLRDAEGRTLGLLARLRDVLPGRYAFGLTGRGPDGRLLTQGSYELRLVAWPAAGGKAVKRTVRFSVE